MRIRNNDKDKDNPCVLQSRKSPYRFLKIFEEKNSSLGLTRMIEAKNPYNVEGESIIR